MGNRKKTTPLREGVGEVKENNTEERAAGGRLREEVSQKPNSHWKSQGTITIMGEGGNDSTHSEKIGQQNGKATRSSRAKLLNDNSQLIRAEKKSR